MGNTSSLATLIGDLVHNFGGGEYLFGGEGDVLLRRLVGISWVGNMGYSLKGGSSDRRVPGPPNGYVFV